jgi:hypothetical protein
MSDIEASEAAVSGAPSVRPAAFDGFAGVDCARSPLDGVRRTLEARRTHARLARERGARFMVDTFREDKEE